MVAAVSRGPCHSMESILVKILAVVLALSQVSTRPDDVRTQFDAADRAQVVELLRAGCAHMRKVFEVEDLALDDLVETALADPTAIASEIKAFRGINFGDLNATYRELCKNETPNPSPIDIGQVIDGKGAYFAELYEPGNRRIPVSLSEIPETVSRAFVAAEDKRFFQHKGIDERGLVRAFVVNMMQPGRPQGGSTITQQVVKNLVVGDDVTYERKIREMIVATDLERVLTKPEILQLYLNSTYLGRGSWGVEMAARSYFGKSAKELTLAEGAVLAGLTKGPNFFNPDRHPDRAKQRYSYTLSRMQEDQVISADQVRSLAALPELITFERPRRNTGFHYIDFLSK